jgi:hypothetical protein
MTIGYPDANYAAPPDYTVDSGTNCENAKPYRFYEGATFCNDVEIRANLTVGQNITSPNGLIGGAQFTEEETVISVPVLIDADAVVRGRLITEEFQVKEIEFRAVRLPIFDNYYVLASYIPPN